MSAPRDDFWQDLRRSLAIWRAEPRLPVFSLLVWGVPALPSAIGIDSLVFLVWSLIFVGWAGTEQEWYRRSLAGEPMRWLEIWSITRRYFGRFLRLTLAALALLGILLVLSILSLLISDRPLAGAASTGRLWIVPVFATYVAATFIAPALTFTTASAREAIKIGLRLLREQRRAAAPYALILAAVLTFSTDPGVEPLFGPAAGLAANGFAILASLAVTGATVFFYLRHSPQVAGMMPASGGSQSSRAISPPALGDR